MRCELPGGDEDDRSGGEGEAGTLGSLNAFAEHEGRIGGDIGALAHHGIDDRMDVAKRDRAFAVVEFDHCVAHRRDHTALQEILRLREIEARTSVDDALACARRRHVVRREPVLIEQDDRRLLVMPGDPLHPDRPAEPPPAEARYVWTDRRWRATTL